MEEVVESIPNTERDLMALITSPVVIALVVFVVMLVVLGLAWFALDSSKCPSCGGMMAREMLRKERLDVRIIREADDYYEGDHHRDMDHVIKTEYRGYYRCRRCGHEWTGTFVEQTEV